MILGLIKKEEVQMGNDFPNLTKIKFNFLKNMIKKDMEVVSWQNNAVKVFGEFCIYSDLESELNSFDHIITFLTGRPFEFSGDSVESFIAFKCPEHFLTFLIARKYKFEEREMDALASKYTYYMLEAVDLLNAHSREFIQTELRELDKKYFVGNDPTAIWRCINPK